MIRNLIAASFLCTVFSASALADETFSLKVGFASLDPDGKFAGENGGVSTKIDFDDDLNFDESEGVYVEGAFQLGPFRFSAAYLPLDFSGRGTITSNITFDGRTFTTGTNVASDVEMEFYDLAVAFHLINFDDGPMRVQLGPEVAVKIADVDLSIRDTSGGPTESVSGTVPVPTIGARARIALSDFVGVVGRFGYLEIQDNSFLDAEIQVEYSPLPTLGVFAGYRYIDVDVDESDVILQSTFSGLFAGVFARF